VVAEVLFPNGLPFQSRPFDDVGTFSSPELNRQARMAYNRWLADFCALTPGRRAGQAVVSFDDVDQAVADIHWAKEHGLAGMMMPALLPGDTFFFDPVLDPIWAACEEVDLPISQHGGSGAPGYNPPGFAAIMTLAYEHSFFSGRSLWQMILGGVFERFPNLRMAFVETEGDWIGPAIRKLDKRLSWGDDWTGWAAILQRQRAFTRRARDYWADNCYSGISPFTADQVPLEELARPSAEYETFAIGCDNAMFGVDYPHFESIFPDTKASVDALVTHPSITPEVARKIMCGTAARVYGFDLERLQPDADRIGFDVETQGAAQPA
jgi:predicted TIM-barrel fold metal-dependent hydrolase